MGGSQTKGLRKRELCRLRKQIDMPVDEIQKWYIDFKRNAENGRYLNREQFRDVYTDMFGSGASDFADNVFRTFDRDGNGCVDFEEFILGIYMSSSNDIDLKLKWAFNMYDIDGNGSIDKHELFAIINCSFNIFGKEEGRQTAEELTESLFFEMDADGDGEISWEEFYTTACKDKRLLQLLHIE